MMADLEVVFAHQQRIDFPSQRVLQDLDLKLIDDSHCWRMDVVWNILDVLDVISKSWQAQWKG